MKREIRRMLTAVLFAAAILLLPEISVNVSAQENISGVIVNGQIVTGFVPGVSADAAAQAEGGEIAAERQMHRLRRMSSLHRLQLHSRSWSRRERKHGH